MFVFTFSDYGEVLGVATPAGTKGATSGALPAAGILEPTYLLFIAALLLIFFGFKLLMSSKNS